MPPLPNNPPLLSGSAAMPATSSIFLGIFLPILFVACLIPAIMLRRHLSHRAYDMRRLASAHMASASSMVAELHGQEWLQKTSLDLPCEAPGCSLPGTLQCHNEIPTQCVVAEVPRSSGRHMPLTLSLSSLSSTFPDFDFPVNLVTYPVPPIQTCDRQSDDFPEEPFSLMDVEALAGFQTLPRSRKRQVGNHSRFLPEGNGLGKSAESSSPLERKDSPCQLTPSVPSIPSPSTAPAVLKPAQSKQDELTDVNIDNEKKDLTTDSGSPDHPLSCGALDLPNMPPETDVCSPSIVDTAKTHILVSLSCHVGPDFYVKPDDKDTMCISYSSTLQSTATSAKSEESHWSAADEREAIHRQSILDATLPLLPTSFSSMAETSQESSSCFSHCRTNPAYPGHDLHKAIGDLWDDDDELRFGSPPLENIDIGNTIVLSQAGDLWDDEDEQRFSMPCISKDISPLLYASPQTNDSVVDTKDQAAIVRSPKSEATCQMAVEGCLLAPDLGQLEDLVNGAGVRTPCLGADPLGNPRQETNEHNALSNHQKVISLASTLAKSPNVEQAGRESNISSPWSSPYSIGSPMSLSSIAVPKSVNMKHDDIEMDLEPDQTFTSRIVSVHIQWSRYSSAAVSPLSSSNSTRSSNCHIGCLEYGFDKTHWPWSESSENMLALAVPRPSNPSPTFTPSISFMDRLHIDYSSPSQLLENCLALEIPRSSNPSPQSSPELDSKVERILYANGKPEQSALYYLPPIPPSESFYETLLASTLQWDPFR